MAGAPTLVVDVYEKGTLQWLGAVPTPVSVSGSLLLRSPDHFELRVAGADPTVPDLLTKGNRYGIRYRGKQVSSGLIRNPYGDILPGGDVVVQLAGDRRVLDNVLAWVRPDGALQATSLTAGSTAALGQAVYTGGALGANGTVTGQSPYYAWGTGTSYETLIKRVIQQNLTRLGLTQYTIAPDLGRGGAVVASALPQIRFDTLTEAVEPLLDLSGLELSVLQGYRDDTITIDVFEGDTWDQALTAASGVLTGGQWHRNDPTATRVVAGGPGEDAARVFDQLVGTDGYEDDYGDIIEVWTDATGANLNWPDSLDESLQVPKYYAVRTDISSADKTALSVYLAQQEAKSLADGQANTTVDAALSESESFYFGGDDGVQLGDFVTLALDTGSGVPLLTDRINEVEFDWAQDSRSVTPILGTPDSDPDRALAQRVVDLARSLNRLSKRR
jgi:hypothetical protein